MEVGMDIIAGLAMPTPGAGGGITRTYRITGTGSTGIPISGSGKLGFDAPVDLVEAYTRGLIGKPSSIQSSSRPSGIGQSASSSANSTSIPNTLKPTAVELVENYIVKGFDGLSRQEQITFRALAQGRGSVVRELTVLNNEYCFAAGTPLLTPDGAKAVEHIRVGDFVLSRHESNANGEIEAKQVEEVFVRAALIWHLHLGQQVIRTTGEHPFYVHNLGWLPCKELKIGDCLLCADGTTVEVKDLLGTGEWEVVYNIRVADYHTYFVGCEEWGFSVWAHNACVIVRVAADGSFELYDIGAGKVLTSSADIADIQAAINAGGHNVVPGAIPANAPPRPPGKPAGNFTPPTNPPQYPAIPAGFVPEPIPGGGVVYRLPGTTGDANTIRIMPATAQYPNGYFVITNKYGQPVTPAGKTGGKPDTHIPLP
jgi:hypothetical protein